MSNTEIMSELTCPNCQSVTIYAVPVAIGLHKIINTGLRETVCTCLDCETSFYVAFSIGLTHCDTRKIEGLHPDETHVPSAEESGHLCDRCVADEKVCPLAAMFAGDTVDACVSFEDAAESKEK